MIISTFYLRKGEFQWLFGINVLIIYFLGDKSGASFFLLFYGLPALVMSHLSLAGEGYYKLQKWGTITAVVGVTLFLSLIYLSAGTEGITQIQSQINAELQSALYSGQNAAILKYYEEKGISREEIEKTFSLVVSAFTKHLPAFYYLQAIMAAFFMLILASWVNLKQRIDRLKKKPFIKEIMPWQITWVAIAGLLLWMWGQSQNSDLYYVGSNTLVVLVPITAYFGFSTIMYMVNQRKSGSRNLILAGLIIVTVMFPLSAIIFCSLTGLFDSLMNFRKFGLKKGE
jgi:hypothetical protein